MLASGFVCCRVFVCLFCFFVFFVGGIAPRNVPDRRSVRNLLVGACPNGELFTFFNSFWRTDDIQSACTITAAAANRGEALREGGDCFPLLTNQHTANRCRQWAATDVAHADVISLISNWRIRHRDVSENSPTATTGANPPAWIQKWLRIYLN